MASDQPFCLFVYGTLMNPWVFRTVLGKRLVERKDQADGKESFWARWAILDGYEKVSPDNTYQYAVPNKQGRIGGYVIGPLPAGALSHLRRYEGRNYSQRKVVVHTGGGDQQALVFVGNLKKLQHAFGYDFRDRFKQEVILGEKIDSALRVMELEQLHTLDSESRQAVAELRGDTIRDLQRRHFEAGGISDYAIRASLAETPLPSYEHLRGDDHARPMAPSYLRFVIRQVLLNQVEERLHHDCRYELDRMSPGQAYYDRTFSLLAALRLINQDHRIAAPLARALDRVDFDRHDLIDAVRQGVVIASEIYDPSVAAAELDFINHHTHCGAIPLGAELEFSQIGHDVIRDPHAQTHRDEHFDGFFYFGDFALDALTWKVGGHVDDHHEKIDTARRRGFFEAALGNLSVRANISKPVTNDPWTLNQLIHETRRFYEVAPHSVHISLQLRSNHEPMVDRPLPLSVLKCLFALSGDPQPGPDGRAVIHRLASDEIRRELPCPTMMFSQVSRRHSQEAETSHAGLRSDAGPGRYVQQFKFLRLGEPLNYEPIVVALKGLQIRYRPGNFMVGDQYVRVDKIRRRHDELLEWGRAAGPLAAEDIDGFLGAVGEGLQTEHRGRRAHRGAYIDWSQDQLREMLARFNRLVSEAPPNRAD